MISTYFNKPRTRKAQQPPASAAQTRDGTVIHAADWFRETRVERRKRKNRERQARHRGAPVTIKASTRKDRCMALLRDMLADGPRCVAKILYRAARAGLEPKGATRPGKAMRLAREALGIKPVKIGLTKGWIWRLPESEKTQCLSKVPFERNAATENSQEAHIPSKVPLHVTPIRRDKLGGSDSKQTPPPAAAPGGFQRATALTPPVAAPANSRWRRIFGEPPSLELREAAGLVQREIEVTI